MKTSPSCLQTLLSIKNTNVEFTNNNMLWDTLLAYFWLTPSTWNLFPAIGLVGMFTNKKVESCFFFSLHFHSMAFLCCEMCLLKLVKYENTLFSRIKMEYQNGISIFGTIQSKRLFKKHWDSFWKHTVLNIANVPCFIILRISKKRQSTFLIKTGAIFLWIEFFFY